ncbi:Uncharacterised protein [Salmonella enterica subsp. enterica serovar Bovismorbificans]|uniref:Uncharacterized protein n=1 Tax=Salmonella enterica subsp. enterica serovar Bovismorbificans TaxID=58097 RepID=A0A655BKH5_SALET|nr:Uncharacterised protein [Salmonella enterica subsp. enterica serovar Bovismorbificans]
MTHIIAKLYAVMDKRPAFLRDGDSAGRMYVLGPVTVCRQDQHA